ncbi:MAG TPA: plastocyanin/azurin family copper-binding protein, partial [Cyclobacteriaceae bacterium]|nr:plastocyanin/azurin family copper-binding protein [Cyclobacteriaceae bacterium]
TIDGLVWFRKAVELPASAAGKKGTISLGNIDDSDITYINGIKVGSIERRYNDKRVYEIPAGVLKAGKNSIAIRVEDTGGGGGLPGKPEELFLQTGGTKISLAGNWKYDVELEYGSRRSMFDGTTIGKLFADNNAGKDSAVTTSATGAQVIKLGVIKNEMKYDLKEFTVEAGRPVEIVFENLDFMQHNLVIGQIGSLETIGKAADKLASDPQGAEKHYVPQLAEVLYSTKLVNPQQTETLKFVAPAKTGDYPYVCTFPGHWSIMNGVMKVVPAKAL